MKTALLSCALVAVAACGKGAGHERFEKLASLANPVIKKVRPSAAIVLDPTTSDIKALRTACRQGVADAAPLATAGFHDRVHEGEQMGVDDVMFTFTQPQQLELACREDQGDGTRDARCKSWCVSAFGQLSSALEKVRQEAAKEDVEIEPLLKN